MLMGKTKLAQVLMLLEPRQLKRLNRLAKATGKPRMVLLRQAVDDLLAKRVHGAGATRLTRKRRS